MSVFAWAVLAILPFSVTAGPVARFEKGASYEQTLPPMKDTANGMLCSPCISLGSQGINILVNYIVNAGVLGGCGELCSHLTTKTEQEVCNLACDVVGVNAFVKALNHSDLDPFYLCETVSACPKPPDTADAEIVEVKATPSSIAKGDTIELECDMNVRNATGTGEFRMSVTGPVTVSISQSFVLAKGVPEGQQALSVKLTVADDTSGDEPVTWQPGTYTFEFEVCQGECGSKHPHSKVFGKSAGNFTLTDASFYV